MSACDFEIVPVNLFYILNTADHTVKDNSLQLCSPVLALVTKVKRDDSVIRFL